MTGVRRIAAVVRQRGAGRPLIESFGASALVLVFGMLSGVLLARVLGPKGRGELASVLLWPSLLATLGSLNLGDATTYHTAAGTAPLGRILGTSLAVAAAQSLALLAIGVAIMPIVHADRDGSLLRIAYAALAFIPIYLITLYLLSALSGLHRFRAYQALRLSIIVVNALLVAALALAGRLSVATAVVTYMAAHLAAGAVAATALLAGGHLRLQFSGAEARRLLRFGVRSHLGGVSANLNERIDQLVISLLLTPAKLGLYVVAVTMTSVTGLIGTSVSTVAFPVIARLGPGPARDAAVCRYIRLTLLAATAATVPFVLALPLLIDALFGPPYASAAGIGRMLLAATIFLSISRALAATLKALDRPLDASIAEVIALGVTFVGLAALLPALGLMGAAIASLLAYVTSMVWLLRRTSRALDLSVGALLLPDRATVVRLALTARRLRPAAVTLAQRPEDM